MSTGVWFVGARGNVATTAMVGARAIARDKTGIEGLVTERAPCDALDLPGIEELVFGGHDIQEGSVVETAAGLHERNGVPDRDALEGDGLLARNGARLRATQSGRLVLERLILELAA